MSWIDAAQACEIIGAHLVSLESMSDEDELGAFIPDAATVTLWTGLTDQWSEGTFVWYEGPDMFRIPGYTNWAELQPDNSPGEAGDCAFWSGADDAWFDDDCQELRTYVCEYVF